jgi:hypothetical protein
LATFENGWTRKVWAPDVQSATIEAAAKFVALLESNRKQAQSAETIRAAKRGQAVDGVGLSLIGGKLVVTDYKLVTARDSFRPDLLTTERKATKQPTTTTRFLTDDDRNELDTTASDVIKWASLRGFTFTGDRTMVDNSTLANFLVQLADRFETVRVSDDGTVTRSTGRVMGSTYGETNAATGVTLPGPFFVRAAKLATGVFGETVTASQLFDACDAAIVDGKLFAIGGKGFRTESRLMADAAKMKASKADAEKVAQLAAERREAIKDAKLIAEMRASVVTGKGKTKPKA